MLYLFKTTQKYRMCFIILFFSIIFSTVTGTLFPYAIGKIVDQIFYTQCMNDFLFYFIIYALLYFFNQCSYGVLNYTWAHLKNTYVVNIRKACFEHLMKLKASVWTRINSGDVLKRILDDTECYLEFIHRSVFYIFANFLQLVISIGYMLYANVFIGLIALIMTPIMAYTIRYFAVKLKHQYHEIEDKKGLIDAWILEMMRGIAQWKLLNASEIIKSDYQKKTEGVIKKEIEAGYLNITSQNVNEALTLIGQLIIYCIAAFYVGRDSMTMGQFVACASYFSTCASYYNALGQKITDISVNLVGIHRVQEFLDWEEEKELFSSKDYVINKGNICFENISFEYCDRPVLKSFNLEIRAGEKVSLVGKSGEGKSTLLSLLYRFYEPTIGKIFIDDKDIRDYTLKSIRSQIAVVQQDNGLFYGSLRKNIILSDDTLMDSRIWEILEGLNLKKLVEDLPEGLDTIVGVGGRTLSGGQKQRIAIARCIFREPQVLLLDEATSALDEDTEKLVNSFIYHQLPYTTIVSVSHRFSSILMADKIVVIEKGGVSDIGTHEYLTQNNALYQSMYNEYQNAKEYINLGDDYE